MTWYNHMKAIMFDPSFPTAPAVGEAPLALLLDIIRVPLMRAAYTFDADHEAWGDAGVSSNEIAATGYVADGDGRALATKVVTQDDANDRGELDADDLAFLAIGNGLNDTIAEIILFREQDAGPTDANRLLVAHTTVPSTTTNGGDVTLVWNTEGILHLT